MATLVDSNILIDVLNVGSSWGEWSFRKLGDVRREGPIVINQLVLAELSAGFFTRAQLDDALDADSFQREDIPWDAAFLAGQAFRQYRRSGGEKTSPLPDFYIGAHALVRGYRLISRDVRRYRAYFPDLELIAPDTHP